MLVLLDAKRGDIGTTAEGYARATSGAAPGFDADCVTVNPYLGKDTLEPFLALAERDGKGRRGAGAHVQSRRARFAGSARRRRAARGGAWRR